MILGNVDVKNEMKKGNIRIFPLKEEQIGPASIDLTLDNKWWKFKKGIKSIDAEKQRWDSLMEPFFANELTIKPKELILGITKEKITLSNKFMGILEGRSRYARIGLSIHITSALVHPGVDNHQVLEIVNNTNYPIKIKAGMRISQVVFFQLKSATSRPYKKVGEISVKQ